MNLSFPNELKRLFIITCNAAVQTEIAAIAIMRVKIRVHYQQVIGFSKQTEKCHYENLKAEVCHFVDVKIYAVTIISKPFID